MKRFKVLGLLLTLAFILILATPCPSYADTDTVKVSIGTRHSLILKADGTVWGMGLNTDGQVGNMSTPVATPVQVEGLSDVVDISAGRACSFAVKSDGTVWAWGRNSDGEYGIGTTISSKVPVQITNLSGVTAISSSLAHTLVLKSDGTVWAWGSNSKGQLGDGTITTSKVPVQVSNLSGVTSISTGHTYSMALKSDGTVWAWGQGGSGNIGDGKTTLINKIPLQVGGENPLTGVTEIASGGASLALKSDGSVWAWGAAGCIGDGTQKQSNVPVMVPGLNGVKHISAGYCSCAVVKSDGTVWVWGNNTYGQLANGPIGTKYAPIQVPNLSNISILSKGCEAYSIIAVNSDGYVWGWGQNYGMLGDGSTVNKNTSPVQVHGNNNVGFFNVYQGEIQATSLVLNKTNVTFSTNNSAFLFAVVLPLDAQPENATWSSSNPSVVSVNEKGKITGVAFGSATITATSGSGLTASCNVTVTTGAAPAVSAGGYHTMALKADGSVWAWGENDVGQIGNGTQIDVLNPVKVITSGVRMIYAAGRSSLLLSYGNGLTGWGNNGQGAYYATKFLGDYPNRWSPRGVGIGTRGTPIDIATNGASGFYLQNNGTVWGWGDNWRGVLGNKPNIPDGYTDYTGYEYPSVQTLNLSDIVDLESFTALKSDGTVWVWGPNGSGQLGNGGAGDVSNNTARKVSQLNGIIYISAGGNTRWAIAADGTVWAWGNNSNGQINGGAEDKICTPIKVLGLSDIVAIKSGANHTLALKSDGTVLAWGGNAYGQLGDGSIVDSYSPVPVSGISGIIAIEAGSYTSYAIASDGTIYAWGRNNKGQLGDSTLVDKTTPVIIGSGNNIPVTGISLDITDLTLMVGNSETITATISPADATNKTITWTSADPTIATVDSSGNVTGVSVGNVVISGTAGGVTANCNVTVTDQAVAVTDLTLNLPDLTIETGNSETLITTITPSNATNKHVTWTSSDPTIATVDSAGKVTGISIGDIIITVTTVDGSHSATCNVHVVENVSIPNHPAEWRDKPLSFLEVIPETCDLLVDATKQLVVKGHFTDGTVYTVTNYAIYTSNHSDIAKVSSTGLITGVTPGASTITVTLKGKSATCMVTVNQISVTGVSLDVNDLNLTVGENKTLVATITPANATNKNLTWVSSDSSIATVDQKGKVTGIKAGELTVTVTSVDGNLSATANITVTEPTATLQSLLVSPTPISLSIGENQRITVKARYTNGNIQDVTTAATYTSNKPEIAAMDATNINQVNGIAVGTSTVTVIYEGKSGNIPVTVSNPVAKSLYIEPSPINLATGMTKDIKVIARLSNGSILDVTNEANLVIADSTKATINGKTIKGVQQDTTTLTATYQGISATALVIVQAPIVQSLTISLNPINIAVGKTSDVLVVKAVKSDGTEEIISNSKVQFSFGTAGIASITGDYRILGKTAGNTVLTASYSGLTAQTNVNVGQALIERLVFNPNPVSVTVGKSVTITATVVYSDGSQQTVQATMTPHESNSGFTISNNQLTGTVVGSYNLDITYGSLSVQVPVTVTAATVESMSVSDITVGVGQSKAIQAIAHMSDGTTQDISTMATYTLMNSSIASVTSNQITGKSSGTTVLTVKYQGMIANANVTVTAPVATGLTVSPNPISCSVGDSVALTVTATMSDGTTKNVTTLATYGNSNQIVDINSNGVLLALKAGTAEVVITYNGNSVSVPVTVNYQPEPIKVVQGNYKILITSGISGDVNVKFTLSSNDPSTVYIPSSTSNRVYGKKLGICTITVTYYNSKSGISASYQVPVQVVSVPVNKPK